MLKAIVFPHHQLGNCLLGRWWLGRGGAGREGEKPPEPSSASGPEMNIVCGFETDLGWWSCQVIAFDQISSRCCWLNFGCKFTHPNYLFKSKNWIPLSQYNLCLWEITRQPHHIKLDRWVCSVGAMPGPDIRPYQLFNRKNWGVMHCNLEQSVCCVLILVAGTFELWHCHSQTTVCSVDVM